MFQIVSQGIQFHKIDYTSRQISVALLNGTTSKNNCKHDRQMNKTEILEIFC